MSQYFEQTFNSDRPTLPLSPTGNIVCGNSINLDWDKVCPKNDQSEIYVIGNPPYVGSSMQTKDQKQDIEKVFKGNKSYKNLDYVACWFLKATDYINSHNIRVSFVSTNSITQGEQVASLWPLIFSKSIDIQFAYKSFKWTNNARGNAGVTCSLLDYLKLIVPKKLFMKMINL